MSVPTHSTIRPALAPLVAMLALLFTLPAIAQEDESGLPLWEVSHEESTVYLMGSVHILRPDVYPLADALYEAFDAADVAVFELDLSEIKASGAQIMTAGMYDDGRTLEDALPVEMFAEVETRAAEVGLPAEAVQQMKPWMVSVSLGAMVMQEAGFEAASGIDLHFHERAMERGIDVDALETVEEQIEVFDGLTEEAQLAMLRSTLDELDTAAADLDEATELWRRGDADGLADAFTDSLGDQPELLERLLYARNRNWIPMIEAHLERPATTIVIVGMGHLIGEGSVIELLEERGYTVERWGEGAAVGAP